MHITGKKNHFVNTQSHCVCVSHCLVDICHILIVALTIPRASVKKSTARYIGFPAGILNSKMMKAGKEESIAFKVLNYFQVLGKFVCISLSQYLRSLPFQCQFHLLNSINRTISGIYSCVSFICPCK